MGFNVKNSMELSCHMGNRNMKTQGREDWQVIASHYKCKAGQLSFNVYF